MFKIEIPAWLVLVLLLLGLTVKKEADGSVSIAGVKWH
jgi:hypothetical protein